jgi:hypothetical protein
MVRWHLALGTFIKASNSLGADAQPAHCTWHNHRHPRVSAIQAARHPLSPTQRPVCPLSLTARLCRGAGRRASSPSPPPIHSRPNVNTSVTPPRPPAPFPQQAAIFNFASWVSVFLLFVCACTYLHTKLDSDCSLQGRPSKFSKSWQHGIGGLWWKAARIGERCSPYVSVACVFMALHTLFF